MKQLRCWRNRPAEKQSGAAMVETALTLTILSMLLFGVMSFGRMIYAYTWVSHAAREATRYACVRGAKSASPATTADVQNFVSGSLTGLDASQLTVTTTWNVDNNPACAPSNSPGCSVQVVVKYKFLAVVPYVPQSAVTLQSSSTTNVIQ